MTKMTRQQEHDFYADPDNQIPQGPARRRSAKLTELVPVRFPPETLDKIRDAAGADDRSVSSWIRRAVEHELEHGTTRSACMRGPRITAVFRLSPRGGSSECARCVLRSAHLVGTVVIGGRFEFADTSLFGIYR